MDTEIDKIIKTQIEKLPLEVKNILTNPELGDKILNIGKKNGIVNIEQLGILQTETNLVLLGLVHPDEYPNELKNNLNINDEKVIEIIKDVNEQIFLDVREKLKEIYEKDNDNLENGEKAENIKNTPSVLEQKLGGVTQTQKTETDHSITNIANDTTPKKTVDPYRMPIE